MATEIKTFCTALVAALSLAVGRSTADSGLAFEQRGDRDVVVLWRTPALGTVRLNAPAFVIRPEGRADALPVKLRLTSHKCTDGGAECEYTLAIDHGAAGRTGKYRLAYSVSTEDKRVILKQVGRLSFDKPLRLDVRVTHAVELAGKLSRRCTFPLRYGVVRSVDSEAPQTASAYFTLGRGATAREGEELAMPVIGLGEKLALAADPYCGVQFRVAHRPNRPSVTMSTTYTGSLVPVKDEKRTTVLVCHGGGIDAMLSGFYEAVGEIEPGAAWIHEVHLNYYDYLSKGGRGWFDDLKKLADKIPPAQRKSVVACLHGWYDYLGRYSFDRKTGKLADEWIAFPRTRKTPMSKAEIHKRIRFAKDLGFRAVLYFADGLNSDSAMPDYLKAWLFKDERGNVRKGWTGPSTGTTYTLDPSHPQVRRFFLSYAEALLREYGREIDGLVWDETHYITQERLSSGPAGLSYADRDFMTLVAQLTQLVQRWRKHNADLVFLTSDNVGAWAKRHVPYALVSHGTYQDSAMDPRGWPTGLLPNYRNCLWSCNWHPIRNRSRNRIAPDQYGLPQGLSNGYGDNVGPADMSAELLDEVVQRSLHRAKEGGRKRYLTHPTAHVVLPPAACTTRQDAAGGCDGLKTGTWGFCTSREAGPWWQVDLGSSRALDRVVIYNRCDGGVEGRARRLKVLLSADGRNWTQAYQHTGSAFFGHTDGRPLSVPLKGAKTRFVRIQLPGEEYLHLDEVEVYAAGDQTNLALRRPADQSSVSEWSTPGPAPTRLPNRSPR